mmetsp:Transcript_3832/g.9311  ORF Transcript_3832/g.9311 Transcript_3832/m.9311 type:complete len:133 (-) Transcript_3832:1842-2240(-)
MAWERTLSISTTTNALFILAYPVLSCDVVSYDRLSWATRMLSIPTWMKVTKKEQHKEAPSPHLDQIRLGHLDRHAHQRQNRLTKLSKALVAEAREVGSKCYQEDQDDQKQPDDVGEEDAYSVNQSGQASRGH